MRVIIFATQNNLIHLENAGVIICDGTFYACPKPFRQVYTFMCMIREKTYPIAYALMESTNKQSYDTVFGALKQHISERATIILDFEAAPIISVKNILLNFKITGCYFHFTQCIWRQIQRMGKQVMYRTNVKFQTEVKMVCALAFVPSNRMEYEFANLTNYFLNNNADECILELIFYVEKNFLRNYIYIYQDKSNNDEFIFSIYNNTVNGLPRTQNSIEGWHRSLNARTTSKHQSLFNLFKELQHQQNSCEIKIMQSLYSTNIERERNCEFKNVCVTYNNFYGVEYLLKIAFLTKLKFE